jgi:serine/threonine protein kinase
MNNFTNKSGTVYEPIKIIGEGGQGYICVVKKKKKTKCYAVKFYKQKAVASFQKPNIENLIGKNPQPNDKRVSFIWPIDLVKLENNNSFGYVMPLYDSKKFIQYNKVIGGFVKQPTLKSLSLSSYLICVALEAIHKENFAYCDINLGNIQFDFINDEIIICDNDNVITKNSDVNILGVPDFMAPEIANKTNKPNEDSDLYSLAILLYQFWTFEHPMEGKKTKNVKCWGLVAKNEHYHKNPIFAHHPTNHVNSIDNLEEYKTSLRRWKYYVPTRLKNAFIQIFTAGVFDSNKRIRTNEWKYIFLEMYMNTIACKCGAQNVIDIGIKNQQCFKCKNKFSVHLYLTISSMNVAVYDGAKLYSFLIDDNINEDSFLEIGQIESHPKLKDAYILRNISDKIWYYKDKQGFYSIKPSQARAIVLNAELFIDGKYISINQC